MSKRSSTMPQPSQDRVSRLRAELKSRRLDAFLIQDRIDQYWLTGFTGESGQVLVTPDCVTLLTDGRFDETADTEAPWARKILRKKRSPQETAQQIKRSKLGRVGFEPAHMPVSLFADLTKLVRPAKLVAASGLIGPMRSSKDAGEIERIRNAIRIAEQAYLQLQGWLKPGMTEAYVGGRLTFEMQQLGAQGSAFDPIVASGKTASLPHYEPGSRPISRAEGLLIDWGARAGWYVSDLTRVIWPGSIPSKLGKVYDVVREAHDRAIEAVRPGLKASAIDAVARGVIRKAGFDKQFTHALGHGIGLAVHEAPRLGQKSDDVLKPGMVVTIEPGIYLPGVGGVRLEDDVLVTETGYEKLSSLPC
ncbi:MAG: aminopeptidase P family protein [Planctomycetes bacterium]|nr:aminopeptidase P family protein [Planctomycetota bacterium]